MSNWVKSLCVITYKMGAMLGSREVGCSIIPHGRRPATAAIVRVDDVCVVDEAAGP
jgi:hypothetical protein